MAAVSRVTSAACHEQADSFHLVVVNGEQGKAER